ncbi:Lrp/AsnC ligand binding domain-containing protein [Candidatus Bathyarchaeota archaeon]|nr:Lrp/AsnC ligand binding domain-containing protein [Candidatus Bathyarchaeota archaeon]
MLKVKGDHRSFMEKLSKFDKIEHVYNIAGDNDVLIEAKTKNLGDFKDLINRIRSMENALQTTSYIVLSRYK